MDTYTVGMRGKVGARGGESPEPTLLSQPALLHWITPRESEAMREALVRGCLPPDFLRKLGGLAAGDLGHRFIEQNCRLFVALLLAVEHGCFRASRRLACERLLRVLAYVRKDNDAIADYQAEGFTDDRREVRAATEELADVLQAFKEWRLRFQVPAMWPGHGPGWGYREAGNLQPHVRL